MTLGVGVATGHHMDETSKFSWKGSIPYRLEVKQREYEEWILDHESPNQTKSLVVKPTPIRNVKFIELDDFDR